MSRTGSSLHLPPDRLLPATPLPLTRLKTASDNPSVSELRRQGHHPPDLDPLRQLIFEAMYSQQQLPGVMNQLGR
jgi:hypothetical protein